MAKLTQTFSKQCLSAILVMLPQTRGQRLIDCVVDTNYFFCFWRENQHLIRQEYHSILDFLAHIQGEDGKTQLS